MTGTQSESALLADTASGRILFGRVLDIARADPTSLALRHKRRGVWTSWSWREVVAEIDRWAAALGARGVGPGTAVAIVGEIDPTLIVSAIAALSLGAALVTASEHADATEIAGLIAARRVRVAIIQSRYSVAIWQDALNQGDASVAIVFDHATPNGASPDRAIATATQFLQFAGPASMEISEARPGARQARTTLWAEASTAWPEALTTIAEAWLSTGSVLALPERLASAAGDRVHIRPDRWIASYVSFAASAADIQDRLPRPGSWTHRLIAPSLRRGSTPTSLVQRLLRRRLGLSRLSAIEIGGERTATAHDLTGERVFASLGVTVAGNSDDPGLSRSVLAYTPEAAHRLVIAGSRR